MWWYCFVHIRNSSATVYEMTCEKKERLGEVLANFRNGSRDLLPLLSG